MNRRSILWIITALAGVAVASAGFAVGMQLTTDAEIEAAKVCADKYPESSGCGPIKPLVGGLIAGLLFLPVVIWLDRRLDFIEGGDDR